MGTHSEFGRFRMVGDRLFFRLRNVPIDSPAFSLTSHDGIDVLFPESVERISGHSVLAADGRYAVPAVHHAHYFAAVVDELLQFGVAAFAASEYDSLFASQRQRLPCTHGYQVSFDFRHQPECETEHLAVYRVVEGVVIFRAVQADLLFEKFSHDRHDVCQGAAQTGEFRSSCLRVSCGAGVSRVCVPGLSFCRSRFPSPSDPRAGYGCLRISRFRFVDLPASVFRC